MGVWQHGSIRGRHRSVVALAPSAAVLVVSACSIESAGCISNGVGEVFADPNDGALNVRGERLLPDSQGAVGFLSGSPATRHVRLPAGRARLAGHDPGRHRRQSGTACLRAPGLSGVGRVLALRDPLTGHGRDGGGHRIAPPDNLRGDQAVFVPSPRRPCTLRWWIRWCSESSMRCRQRQGRS